MYIESDYEPKYMAFYYLEDDLARLEYHGLAPIYDEGITLENKDDFIKKEFELYLVQGA